jgi:hypothetical protein
MAKKNNVNITVGVDQENLKKDWNEAFKVTQSAAKSIEKEAAQMADKVMKSLDSMSPQRQLRALTTLSIKLNEVGASGTKAFQQAAKQAAALKSNIGDTKAEIDALQPDAPFRAFANTAQGAANAFAGIQGAMALVGSESEDLQKTLVKVQGAMALAQGLESIGQLEDAFKQLNLVMKANPALLVGTAFVALAAAAIAIQDSFSDLTEAQKINNEVNEKAIETYADEEALLVALQGKLNEGNLTRKEQQTIIDDFNKEHPKLLAGLKTEGVDINKVNAAILMRVKLLRLEAQAEAAKSLYVEEYKKQLLATQKLNEAQSKGYSFWEDVKGIFDASDIDNAWDGIVEGKRRSESFLQTWEKISGQLAKVREESNKLFNTDFVAQGTPASGGTTVGGKPKKEELGVGAVSQSASIAGLRSMVPKPEEFKLAASGFNALTLSVNSYNNAINKVIVSAEQLSMLLRDSVNSAIIGTAEAFGQALASGQDFGAAVGKSLLLAMANFMRQLGEMFIKAGTAKLAFDNAITIPGGAGIAIAAGFALAAGAAAMTSKLQQQNKPTAFADGGIVYGPTLGLMGEYAGASSNPEVIAPLDKLKSLIGGTGENSIVATTKIDGRDLYLIVQRAGKDMGRG